MDHSLGAQPVPVVLAGIHGHGGWHLRNIRHLQEQGVPLRLAGVCDPAPCTGAEAGLVGDARYSPRLEDVLPGPGGVVIVCTPIHTHATLALTAAEAGSAVLLEKPPTPTLDEFDRMCAGLERAGAACQIGFQSLGSLALDQVRSLISSGAVGAVRGIGAAGIWQRDVGYYRRAAWAGKRVLDGRPVVDGALTNPFAHAIAGALALALPASQGGPGASALRSITAELFRANDIEADDTSSVSIITADGLPITVAATLAAEREAEPYIVVHGERGRITWEYRTGRVILAAKDGTVARETVHGEEDLLANLVEHVRDPLVPLRVPPASVRSFMEVMEAIRLAPEPTPIPPGLLRIDRTGEFARVVASGAGAAVVEAAASLRPLSEVWGALD